MNLKALFLVLLLTFLCFKLAIDYDDDYQSTGIGNQVRLPVRLTLMTLKTSNVKA